MTYKSKKTKNDMKIRILVNDSANSD